jgi:uncharacterized protein (DUF3084 family)
MSIDKRLDRLTGIVETLAGAVAAHDSMIEGLVRAAASHDAVIEAHDKQIHALIRLTEKNQKAMADLDRRWQAYLNTLRKQ